VTSQKNHKVSQNNLEVKKSKQPWKGYIDDDVKRFFIDVNKEHFFLRVNISFKIKAKHHIGQKQQNFLVYGKFHLTEELPNSTSIQALK